MDPTLPIHGVLRTLRLMWGGFLFTPVVFGLVLAFGDIQPGGADPMLPVALMGVAALAGPMAFALRFVLTGSLALVAPADLRAPETTPVTQLGAPVRKAAMRYQTVTIVSFALAEQVALLGFVASFLSDDPRFFAAAVPVSWLIFFVLFPRWEGVLCLLDPADRQGVRQFSRAQTGL